MSGGPMGNTQQSYGPQPVGGASYNNSASQQRWQPQGYAQQPYQGYGQQNYGQQQMPPWIGNLMSMFQRPGMGYQGGQQWSNPYWQPPPAQQPTPQQGTNIGGSPISSPATLVQQYNDLKQAKQQQINAINPNEWWQAGGSGGY